MKIATIIIVITTTAILVFGVTVTFLSGFLTVFFLMYLSYILNTGHNIPPYLVSAERGPFKTPRVLLYVHPGPILRDHPSINGFWGP